MSRGHLIALAIIKRQIDLMEFEAERPPSSSERQLGLSVSGKLARRTSRCPLLAQSRTFVPP
jgi:hypothetical protein